MNLDAAGLESGQYLPVGESAAGVDADKAKADADAFWSARQREEIAKSRARGVGPRPPSPPVETTNPYLRMPYHIPSWMQKFLI